ncbi:hypothetical protein TWF696_007544 [Orbilia brochopaga]|uniref:Uncharacterized protein n=1 Tax=Orbilia brochopaga TaxID=3140254 RepID=A0AAV9UMU4_9PEZI
MSAAEMFYIPNCKNPRTNMRTRLKSPRRQSPSAILHHAGKRIFDCVVQSLATISLAYGHYPVAVSVRQDNTYSYCPHHPRRQPQIHTHSHTCTAKQKNPRPTSVCSVHSVPDRIASEHNAREKRKVDMQREKKRRPMSAIVFRSSSSNTNSREEKLAEKGAGTKCRYRYLNEELADSLAQLPFLREVQAREFL